MYDFRYVSNKEAAHVKEDLLDMIHEVQNIVRSDFTFQYYFIGSSSRNMITYDTKSNIGFDFDVNIEPNVDVMEFSPENIKKKILMSAFNEIVTRYGYDYCEDSTRVFTIKFKDREHSKILHSCDFAIVNRWCDGYQRYIRYNKKRMVYTWEYQSIGFRDLRMKEEWLKQNGLWGDLRRYYIDKKNSNTNPYKHSRSLLAESINELCQKSGYYDDDEEDYDYGYYDDDEE